MLVLPGAEMTRNTINRDTSVHVLALGLDGFLSADGDPLEMLREIRARGAISVACHPHEMSEFYANTWYLWNRRKIVEGLVDLWEVGCRWDLFPVVSREMLPHIANSDFHRPEHLYAWKTLLPAREERRGRPRGAAARRGHRCPSTGAAGRGGCHRVSAGDPLPRGPVPVRRRARGRGPGARVAAPGRAPPVGAGGCGPAVSVVKPLAGLDAELEANLESFFRQDYPAFEIIFSFAAEADPAFAVARRVADRHPGVPSVFVVDAREPGRNSKINRLAAGLRRARAPYLLFADGDVRVPPDFLHRAVDRMSDPRVGLLSHLFRCAGPSSLGARLEALYLDGVLRPATAAFAKILRTPCVVGKAILISRAALNAIGGLGPLSDYLAEDFLLGRLVFGGPATAWCSRPTRSRPSRARNRSPRSGSATADGRSSAAVWAGSPTPPRCSRAPSRSWRGRPSPPAARRRCLPPRSASGSARMGLEAFALRRSRSGFRARDLLWLPVRDLAVAALFWAGLLGTRTRWRGRALNVGPGTLLRLDEEKGSPGLSRMK